MTDAGSLTGIAFARSPVPMALLDERGQALVINDAFRALHERMTGTRLVDATRSVLDILASNPRMPDFHAAFAEIVSGAKNETTVDGLVPVVGDQFVWLRLTLCAVKKAETSCTSPQVPTVFCVVNDLSDLKEKEITLVAAKEEAERATTTKSQFLANMSHEIRTPIQTITGMTELLLDTELDSEQREYANQIQFSADVLLSLVNDILDFSKIEAGKLTLEVIDFPLHDLIEQAVDLIVLDAHRKGLEFLVYIDHAVPRSVRGDQVRLRQIIVNLIKNAVKFTKAGEIEVSVVMKRFGMTDQVYVTVRDTGIGISAETRKRLFNAFTQADSSTTREFGGTGLGLSIARKFVEMMGGEIGIGDGEGSGSTFWFHVPLPPSDMSATGEPAASLPAGTAAAGEQRILVTDDNRESRRILRTYLGEAGFTVDEAASGPEALDSLRAAAKKGTPFSVCLVDLLMPGMDGWRLAAEVNADRSINNVKLVLLSPQGSMQNEAKMKLLKWFNGYVTKPLKRRELMECLEKIALHGIDLESSGESATAEPAEPLPVVAHKVLLAEDHPINQQLFTVILDKLGHTVSVASDGQEAVESALAEPFDIIFLDIQMPRMNGYEAARAIRQAGVTVPVIALTASAIKGERERCIEAGMDDILTKPFKKHDIQGMLDKWLDSAETAGGASLETPGEGAREPAQGGIPDVVDLNFREAVETFLGNREMVVNLLRKFVEKAEGQIRGLDGLIAAGDIDAVEREVHSIKGSAWNLSAKATGDAAQAVDTAAKAHDLGGVKAALPALQESFARLKVAVTYYTAPAAR